MNLLMIAPLLDSRGILRYFIGAQIDVSGLVKDGTDLDAFQRMLMQQEGHEEKDEPKDEFQELSEMLNHTELNTIRKFGGKMHREHMEEQDDASMYHKPRLLIQDQSTFDADRAEKPPPSPDGRLSGPYRHVRYATLLKPWVIKLTDANSISLYAQRPLSGSSSRHLLYAFRESCNPVSSTTSVATIASENLLPTLSQMALVA